MLFRQCFIFEGIKTLSSDNGTVFEYIRNRIPLIYGNNESIESNRFKIVSNKTDAIDVI